MKEHIKVFRQRYKDRILEYLSTTDKPSDTEKIRSECGIGNWNTALKHCLELLLENRIEGIKSSKSWVFWKLEGEQIA
jgi:hypothetical protein